MLAGHSPLPPRAVPGLDEVATRAAGLLGTPVAMVSLVDAQGQSLPGAHGLAQPWQTERWTPLSHSFCYHVVNREQPLRVSNAHDEPLVAHNQAVLDLGVIAYLGVPLQLSIGEQAEVVGALCAIDHRPREWGADDLARLQSLASEAEAELAQAVRAL